MVGDDFHGEVGFAIGGAAPYRSAHAGRVFRVDPVQSNFLVLFAVELRDPGHGTGSDGVIASQEQRYFARLEAFENQFGALGTGCGDFLQIFCVGGAFFLLLRDSDRDIAAVLDDVADSLETSFESGDTDGRRTHVDASARLAEVEWDADDTNLLGSDGAERRVRCRGHEVSSFRFRVSSSSQKPLTAKIAKTNPRRAKNKVSYGYSRCNV